MRNLHLLDIYRDMSPSIRDAYGFVGDETCGAFAIPFEGRELRVVASSGDGWDHVSVSLPNRCPNWREMDAVKRLFFRDDETAMQLHVPPSDHVNCHPYCLHLWRPNDGREIPRPPSIMVGPTRSAA